MKLFQRILGALRRNQSLPLAVVPTVNQQVALAVQDYRCALYAWWWARNGAEKSRIGQYAESRALCDFAMLALLASSVFELQLALDELAAAGVPLAADARAECAEPPMPWPLSAPRRVHKHDACFKALRTATRDAILRHRSDVTPRRSKHPSSGFISSE